MAGDTGYRILSTGNIDVFRLKQHNVYIYYGGKYMEKWRCISAIKYDFSYSMWT